MPAISHAEMMEDDILRRIRAAWDAEQLAGELTRILHRHMADLAEHLALHPNSISALFTKVSGMSFSQYLRHVRIGEACRLIRITKFCLIGERVEYPDSVHFVRTFRAEVGCSPKE